MMLKYLAVLLMATIFVEGALKDEMLDKLIEQYEKEKDLQQDDIDPRFCGDTPLECYKCAECHDHLQFGLCVKGATGSKCLCKWGWTGSNAVAVPNAGVSEWSRHRIRADHCKTPCHYTHDFWNQGCLNTFTTPRLPTHRSPSCNWVDCKGIYGTCINDVCVPDCDEPKCKSEYGKCIKGVCVPDCDEPQCKSSYGECKKGVCVPTCDEVECQSNGGKCMEGVCKTRCCRNLFTYIPPFPGYDFEKYCIDRCHYVEMKPGACPSLPHIPSCNPKCQQLGGKCDEKTGRCQCCKDFTGPGAKFVGDVIHADYCDVWCYHSNYNEKNLLCVNDDYIERARTAQYQGK